MVLTHVTRFLKIKSYAQVWRRLFAFDASRLLGASRGPRSSISTDSDRTPTMPLWAGFEIKNFLLEGMNITTWEGTGGAMPYVGYKMNDFIMTMAKNIQCFVKWIRAWCYINRSFYVSGCYVLTMINDAISFRFIGSLVNARIQKQKNTTWPKQCKGL